MSQLNLDITGMKKYAEAVADFSKGIELKPAYVTTYMNRAAAYFYQGKKKEALKDWRTAIKIDPKLKPQIQTWAKASNLDLEE